MTPPVSIAIAVVEHAGQFLVGQRPPGVPLAGLWEFPGGKVEPGETASAAAERECFEETGLAVESQGCLLEHVHQYEHGRVKLHFFTCRPPHPCPAPRAPFRWVARDVLDQLEFPAGNRPLIERLRGAF